jgi:hypothetical protein
MAAAKTASPAAVSTPPDDVRAAGLLSVSAVGVSVVVVPVAACWRRGLPDTSFASRTASSTRSALTGWPRRDVSRYLGLLAAALSRLDEAAQFLQNAAEANDRIGALPWSAHAKALARVLLARNAPGDREAASDLLREALATYQQLGMTIAAGKITAEVG